MPTWNGQPCAMGSIVSISQRYKVPYWAVLDLKEVGHSEEVSSREQAVEGHIYTLFSLSPFLLPSPPLLLLLSPLLLSHSVMD